MPSSGSALSPAICLGLYKGQAPLRTALMAGDPADDDSRKLGTGRLPVVRVRRPADWDVIPALALILDLPDGGRNDSLHERIDGGRIHFGRKREIVDILDATAPPLHAHTGKGAVEAVRVPD